MPTLAPQIRAGRSIVQRAACNARKAKLSDETGFDYFEYLNCDLAIGSSPVDYSAARAWG